MAQQQETAGEAPAGAAPEQPAAPNQAPGIPEGGPGGRPGGRPRGRYTPKRRVCQFCVDKVVTINWKDLGRIRRFVSERGKIEPRRKTSTCARHQRKLAEAMKRARHMALLPYTSEHVRATGFFPPRG